MPQHKSSAYKECRHILTTGRKCHSPALTGRLFCHNHARQRNYTGRNQRSINSVELPPLEDHASILIAVNQVAFALTHGRIEDKLAARLLYAIQLAQNSINRLEDVPPEDMVTDYVVGRHGDIVAPAQPETEPGTKPETKPGAEAETESASTPSADDIPLLSDFELSHSGHGDTCWQPSNADYPDPVIDARPGGTRDNSPERQSRNQAADSNAEQVPEGRPNAAPLKPGPVIDARPVGTRDNSPGRQSRNREADPNAEVPEGRPKSNPPKPGPKNSGPWNNPLLDHIVHQLNSGMSEHEVAAQLARDLQANKQANKLALSS
jgi:hypothetical protein